MKKLLLALAAFTAAAACSAGAQTAVPISPAAEANRSAVDCAILTSTTAHGVRFSAVAGADAPLAGSYEFVLTKSDRNGSSDINQGGEFNLSAGASQSLGEAELNLERRSSYHARLVLWDANGEVCRAERES